MKTQPQPSRINPAGSSAQPTGPDAQVGFRPSSAAVAAIQRVSLPPFRPNSPTWLLQVEVHFRLQQTTSQQTRYWHLVSSLPPDVAEDFVYILASPHPSHPYDTLKEAIISRKSECKHSRLQQLNTATELGDRHPSQLLRRMPQLSGRTSALQEEEAPNDTHCPWGSAGWTHEHFQQLEILGPWSCACISRKRIKAFTAQLQSAGLDCL
ncbi:hypothetical protein HPB50_010789 [Hyalomma asiaticum]|uniref:Uncharacterized protein n=1 Tax=Hyalomma asiaticum TaxID=266040 RepID=A0ACB7RK26_HYAAI|nr:hypothetical protein HPB50_010789 [Hyalomma asiaticum]